MKRNPGTFSIIRKLAGDLEADKKPALIACCGTVIAKICLAFAPFVSGKIVDALTEIGTGAPSREKQILFLCVLLAALFFAGYGFDGLLQSSLLKCAQTLACNVRKRMQQKMDRLPVRYMDEHSPGQIQSLMVGDVNNISRAIDESLPGIAGQGVLLLMIVIMMLVSEWRLALIYLAVLPAGLWASSRILARTTEHFRAQADLMGNMTGQISDAYSCAEIVRTFDSREAVTRGVDASLKAFCRASEKAQFARGFILPISVCTNNIAYILLCVIGAMLMINGKLTLGSFQAFLLYGNMVTSPLSALSGNLGSLTQGLASAGRVYDFLDEEEEADNPGSEAMDTGVEGTIRFSHVRFRYEPGQKLMEDVSFTVPAGSTVAVVGPSGAGNTTLVNLLLRFYEIQGGSISIDGRDTSQLTKDSLRRAFGIVLQDAWIFDGTVADNIAYGKKDASKDEIRRIARRMHCDELIRMLPGGYDAFISSENPLLSFGGLQLLSIARTAITNPRILVLDEATSMVDARTERLLTESMKELMKGRTSFVIAHHLDTIRSADLILYMENGNVVESGTHHELMQLHGKYAAAFSQNEIQEAE